MSWQFRRSGGDDVQWPGGDPAEAAAVWWSFPSLAALL